MKNEPNCDPLHIVSAVMAAKIWNKNDCFYVFGSCYGSVGNQITNKGAGCLGKKSQIFTPLVIFFILQVLDRYVNGMWV